MLNLIPFFAKRKKIAPPVEIWPFDAAPADLKALHSGTASWLAYCSKATAETFSGKKVPMWLDAKKKADGWQLFSPMLGWATHYDLPDGDGFVVVYSEGE